MEALNYQSGVRFNLARGLRFSAWQLESGNSCAKPNSIPGKNSSRWREAWPPGLTQPYTHRHTDTHTPPRGSPRKQGHPMQRSAASYERAQNQACELMRGPTLGSHAQEPKALCQGVKPKMAELQHWELGGLWILLPATENKTHAEGKFPTDPDDYFTKEM